MARRLLLLALLASLAGSASAQTAALNGFVRDAQSGETLLQATVRVEGTARGAATNVSGFYTLGDLPPGEATLTASYLGYQPVRRTVTLTAGETTRLDIELTPEGVTTDEVVVEAEEPIEEEFVEALPLKPKKKTILLTRIADLRTSASGDGAGPSAAATPAALGTAVSGRI